jgi:hypothetical protein
LIPNDQEANVCKFKCAYKAKDSDEIHCDTCYKSVSRFKVDDHPFYIQFEREHSNKHNSLKIPSRDEKIEKNIKIIPFNSHKDSNFEDYQKYYKCSIDEQPDSSNDHSSLELFTKIVLVNTDLGTLKYPFQQVTRPIHYDDKQSISDWKISTIFFISIAAFVIFIICRFRKDEITGYYHYYIIIQFNSTTFMYFFFTLLIKN